MLRLSPPGGRKPPVLCCHAFHLIWNNEERWRGREKVDRPAFGLVVTYSLKQIVLVFYLLEDYIICQTRLFSSCLFCPRTIKSSEHFCFHVVSGSLPGRCFLKMPPRPSLFLLEGAVQTRHRLPQIPLINPTLIPLKKKKTAMTLPVFVVFVGMPRRCIRVRRSTATSSASPRGRTSQTVRRTFHASADGYFAAEVLPTSHMPPCVGW